MNYARITMQLARAPATGPAVQSLGFTHDDELLKVLMAGFD